MGEDRQLIALMPMKGHSERVPNKNLRLLCGKPLYHHMMGTLLECPWIEQVYVNTDSAEIAQDIAASFKEGVRVLRRPAAICGDHVTMNTLIAHDLSQVSGERVLQTHSTNPLLTVGTMNRAIEAWSCSEEHDSLVSVNRLQARCYRHDGMPINHDPKVVLMTQALQPVYEENSNLFLFSRTSFFAHGGRVGARPLLFETPKLESIDIDYEEDFQLAEYVAQGRQAASVR